MPSLRKLLGQGGRIALLLLVLYLLALLGVLIGPWFSILALVLVAVAAACILYMRYPEKIKRWLPALPRRGRPAEQPAPGPQPGMAAAASTGAEISDKPIQLPALREPDPADEQTEGASKLSMLETLGWKSPAAMARDFALLGLAGLVMVAVGRLLPEWPLLSWIGGVLEIVGLLCVLFSSGVLYSFGREFFWRGRG
ncbi:hypothetical protein [Rhodovulum sp. YEN HP10]|uniref:hypothetical protein n=1 Tax=Rhodovulum sp. HP10 TaxID=3387397 RepID=UPI0039DFAE70